VQVDIFVLYCHLRFGNCGELGQEKIYESGKRKKWWGEKNTPPLFPNKAWTEG